MREIEVIPGVVEHRAVELPDVLALAEDVGVDVVVSFPPGEGVIGKADKECRQENFIDCPGRSVFSPSPDIPGEGWGGGLARLVFEWKTPSTALPRSTWGGRKRGTIAGRGEGRPYLN